MVFLSQLDLMPREFVYSTVSHENIHFDRISFGKREWRGVVKRYSAFAWITVSAVAYVV